MIRDIIRDFIFGVYDSFQIVEFFLLLITNIKILKILSKIFLFNIIVYIIPGIIFYNVYLYFVIYVILKILSVFSSIIHTLYHIDIANIINQLVIIKKKISGIEIISLSITMFIYQFVMYISLHIVNFLFYEKMYYLSIFMNIGILMIYHSFYCFNNLWQCQRKLIKDRIAQYEKLWPYYIGFGLIGTLIYCGTHKMVWFGVYNIYMSYLIIVPFLVSEYQPQEINYPSINMNILIYLTDNLFSVLKCIFLNIYKIISSG